MWGALLIFTWKMRVAFVIEIVAYQLKVFWLLSQSAGYTRLNEKMHIIINYNCASVHVCVCVVGKSCSHFRFDFDSINLHFIYVTFSVVVHSRVAPTRVLEDY